MTTDKDIEQKIQDKGLTAPRVTPESIAAKIRSEFYFTAFDGVYGEAAGQIFDRNAKASLDEIELSLSTLDNRALVLMTFCILVMDNGFTIVGKSAVASPENFDAELGRKIARADAVNQIWPLEGYLLRDQLAGLSEPIILENEPDASRQPFGVVDDPNDSRN